MGYLTKRYSPAIELLALCGGLVALYLLTITGATIYNNWTQKREPPKQPAGIEKVVEDLPTTDLSPQP